MCSIRSPQDYSNLRWTVDTQEDMDFVRAVYAHLNTFYLVLNWHGRV